MLSCYLEDWDDASKKTPRSLKASSHEFLTNTVPICFKEIWDIWPDIGIIY